MSLRSCGRAVKTNMAGKVFTGLEETLHFDVDEAPLEFIADENIKPCHSRDTLDLPQSGGMTCVQHGVMTLAAARSSAIDSMTRRPHWLQRPGLHGIQTGHGRRALCCTLVET